MVEKEANPTGNPEDHQQQGEKALSSGEWPLESALHQPVKEERYDCQSKQLVCVFEHSDLRLQPVLKQE